MPKKPTGTLPLVQHPLRVKQVLFITYYFPPAGGSPVQRILKYTKYIQSFGWQPVILTVNEGAFAVNDPDLAEQIPADVEVIRTPAWDPFAWYGRLTGKSKSEALSVGFTSASRPDWKEHLARWVRANVFLPDARVGWVRPAIKAGKALIETHHFEAMLSNGPPHSVHLIARSLHRKYQIPWLADFRDPWTDIDYLADLPQTRLARKMDAALERSVLEEADRVVTVSPTCARMLEAKTPHVKVDVIYNGFDASDFEDLTPAPESSFVLLYAGSMNAARNCPDLWKSIADLRKAGELSQFRLRFLGSVDVSVRESLAAYNLLDCTEFLGTVSHHQTLTHMAGSALLLLAINRVGRPLEQGIAPGKMYEYIASGRPILGMGPKDGDAATILNETQAGQMFDVENGPALHDLLRNHYDAWAKGQPIEGADKTRAVPYSRTSHTRRLAQLLDQMMEAK